MRGGLRLLHRRRGVCLRRLLLLCGRLLGRVRQLIAVAIETTTPLHAGATERLRLGILGWFRVLESGSELALRRFAVVVYPARNEGGVSSSGRVKNDAALNSSRGAETGPCGAAC